MSKEAKHKTLHAMALAPKKELQANSLDKLVSKYKPFSSDTV